MSKKEFIALKGEKRIWKQFTKAVERNDEVVWGVLKPHIIEYVTNHGRKTHVKGRISRRGKNAVRRHGDTKR